MFKAKRTIPKDISNICVNFSLQHQQIDQADQSGYQTNYGILGLKYQPLPQGFHKSEQYDQTQLILKRTSKIDLKLFVGQIPKHWLEKDVTSYFSQFGEILESQIIRDKNGYHKGCAFVKFTSMTAAEKAQTSTSGQLLEGMTTPAQIKWADGEGERLGVEPGKIPKIFVGSLPRDCSEDNLRDIFEPFGAIDELHLNRDQEGNSKQTAIIRYEKTESALLAVRNLNAQAYIAEANRPIEVRFADRKIQNYNQHNNEQSLQTTSAKPSITQIWSLYYNQEQEPYFFNWSTQQTQYERPPAGSIVYKPDGSWYAEQEQVQNLNDLQDTGMKKPGPSGANIFIFHLPSNFKDTDLLKLFKDYGSVISARVITQPDGKSKGYGFVSYEEPASAQKAIDELNGLQVANGKRLLVKLKEGEEMQPKFVTTLNQSRFNPF